MKRLSVLFFVIPIVFLGGQRLHRPDRHGLKRQLDELSRIGVTHRLLDQNTIELRDTITGWSRLRTIDEPSETAIRGWAAMRDVPVIDFDPTIVDTSQWIGWYNYWANVPVGNLDVRYPIQAYDFDGNGFPEIYGPFGSPGFGSMTRVYEVYPDGSTTLRHTYNAVAGLSTQVLDVDRNGLLDIVFNRNQDINVYEQPTILSLPTQLKCTYNKYNGLAPYVSIEPMADMDGDSVMDFVHRGADTTLTRGYMLAVSEYNPSAKNFGMVWYTIPPQNEFDGYDVGDYDGDGRMEISASSLWGKVWVIENTGGNDSYALTFQDSLPLVNMFFQASGDVDHDGKRELFVGATMGSGNWTVMYEADSNDHYSSRIVLHLLSGGSLDDPTYFCRDVNSDGQLELVILSGGWMYVFKSNADDSYYLWYLKKGPSSFTVNFHDMDGDGIQDILWSTIRENRWATDIFRGSPLVGVDPEPPALPQRLELQQNYPNPFNPATNFQFSIVNRQFAILKVHNVLGREVATLVNEEKQPGTYTVEWNASGVASGVYFYQLQAGSFTSVKKLLLLK